MTELVISSSKNLQKYLIEIGIVPRKDAGPGVWLSFLLPTAIILGQYKHSISSVKYKAAACISCGLLIHSLCIMNESRKRLLPKSVHSILSALISSVLLYFTTQEGVIFSIGYGFLSVFSYDKMLFPVMKLCPKSFTYGEAAVVTQAFILFLITSLIKNSSPSPDCMTVATILLQVGILCVICIGVLSYTQNLTSRPKEFYLLLLIVVLFVLLPSLYFLIGENPLVWILNLVTEDIQSIQLFGYWLICSMIGVLTIVMQLRSGEKASTIVRKIFHFLALLVFIPGILTKPCLIYVASGVTFAIFVGLDMVRVLNLPPLGGSLQASFNIFADEKDEGPISLTPLYLLAGCALPIWIHPNPLTSELLPLLSGLLAVGIGDTAASVCGTLVGKNKWPGSQKTKEGTAACFLSQLFFVIALIHFGYVPRTNLIKPTFAISVTSLVEAKTDQIDNLSLPLIMYLLLL